MADHSSDNLDLLGLDFGFTTCASQQNKTEEKQSASVIDSKESDIFDLFGSTNTDSISSQNQTSNTSDFLLFDPFAPSHTTEFAPSPTTEFPSRETTEFSSSLLPELAPSQTSEFSSNPFADFESSQSVRFSPKDAPESQTTEFVQRQATEFSPSLLPEFEASQTPGFVHNQITKFPSNPFVEFEPSQSLEHTSKGATDLAPSQTTNDSGSLTPEDKCTKEKDVGLIDISCRTELQPTQTDNMERTNLNRSMEKSFEDLLHGLDSDSEPDLDEMITNHSTISQSMTDDSFNAMAARNKEKLTAEKMKEQQFLDDSMNSSKNENDDFFTSPNQKEDNIISADDWFSSGTNEKQNEKNEIDDFFNAASPKEDNIITTDDWFSTETIEKQNDFKDSDDENVNMEESDDKLKHEETKELDDFLNDIPDHSATDINFNDESEIQYDVENEDTPIVMITQDNEGESVVDGLPREDSLDFSVLQDGNQLDVDIGIQKTQLRKKGSLARRKKPTRNSVRSILSSSEDSHFTDSTEMGKNSRPTSMNGFDADVFGLGLDKESDTTDRSHLDENDGDLLQGIPTSPPAKKPSLSIGTALPGLAGKPLERPSHKTSVDHSEESNKKSDISSIGVKLPMPGLKATPRKSPENAEDSNLFDTPVLKSVPKSDSQKQTFTTDSTFDTPKLKRVTKQRTASQKSEESDESAKIFQKPALRNVSSFDKPENKETESSKTFVKPSLRTVKQDEQKQSFEQISDRQHTFDKPALRSTPMKQQSFSHADHTGSSEDKKSGFDMPALRKTPKPQRKEYTDSEPVKQGGGMFEKPALKAVSTPSLSRTESQESESKHTFDVPSLKSVQRPSRSDSNSSEKSGQSSGQQPSWLKDMKLRRSKSPEKVDKVGKETSQPSWANTAAEKRSKARDLLDSKENQNRKGTDNKTPRLDTPQLRNTPNGLPLQEDNRRRRTSSSDSERSEGEKRKFQDSSQSGKRDQYVPSWMKVSDSRHKSPSTPNLSLSPPEAEKTPQWKIDLAQRRKNRKDSETSSEPQKASDENVGTPSWKLELQKRRKSTPNTPVKSENSVISKEPEWKRKAEEKRQRLKDSGLLDRKPPIKEKPKLTDN